MLGAKTTNDRIRGSPLSGLVEMLQFRSSNTGMRKVVGCLPILYCQMYILKEKVLRVKNSEKCYENGLGDEKSSQRQLSTMVTITPEQAFVKKKVLWNIFEISQKKLKLG